MKRWKPGYKHGFRAWKLLGCGAAVTSLASLTILRSLIFLFIFW